MLVYRIVKLQARTNDLSGTGAYRFGGRWNSKGTYMLYTSETSSLAYLETLVHFEDTEYPPRLYLMILDLNDAAPVYELKENEYPDDWMQLELLENRRIGDRLMKENQYLAIKVKSAVNPVEYNYLLNPLFPAFHQLVSVVDVIEIKLDERLVD